MQCNATIIALLVATQSTNVMHGRPYRRLGEVRTYTGLPHYYFLEVFHNNVVVVVNEHTLELASSSTSIDR